MNILFQIIIIIINSSSFIMTPKQHK